MKKIDFDAALEYLITNMKKLRESDISNGEKTTREKSIGKGAITKLVGRKSRKTEDKASLAYMNKNITRLRSKIKEFGFIHHAFNDSINKIMNENPIAKPQLSLLLDIEYKELDLAIKQCAHDMIKRSLRFKDENKKEQLKNATKKLKSLRFEPIVFETLKRTDEQIEEFNDMAKARLKRYHSGMIEIDYEKTIKTMNNCLRSRDMSELAVGLALASGRRMTEITSPLYGKFKKTNKKFSANFETIIKTKIDKQFQIVLLVDYKIFQESLERFRSLEQVKKTIEEMSHTEDRQERSNILRDSIGKTINRNIKNIMGNEWTIKDMRAIYAKIGYEELKAREKSAGRIAMADDLYYQSNLGHDSSTTQQNYKRFVLLGDKPLSITDIEKARYIDENEHEEITRIEAMRTLLYSDKVQYRRAYRGYVDYILGAIEKEPNAKVTIRFIYEEIGGDKKAIGDFIKILKEHNLHK